MAARPKRPRPLLKPAELCTFLKVSMTTLKRGRERGFDTPPYKRLGTSDHSPIRYDLDEVEAWLEAGSPALDQWPRIWKSIRAVRAAG